MGRVYEIPRVWLAQVRSSSTFHESLVWSGLVQSDRVGSGRVGSGRVGSGRVGSGRVGSGWVGESGRVKISLTGNGQPREGLCTSP